ncbi:hypothetical protein Hanom_Chr11g00988591 [Helianthus anomalus]
MERFLVFHVLPLFIFPKPDYFAFYYKITACDEMIFPFISHVALVFGFMATLFGIGVGSCCSIDESFDLTCNTTYNPPKVFTQIYIHITNNHIKLKFHTFA